METDFMVDTPGVADRISRPPSFDVRSFEIVRRYLEQLESRDARKGVTWGASDWERVLHSVEGADSLEQAIGRAVIVADQIVGSIPVKTKDTVPPPEIEGSFFAFDSFSAIPEFGDGARIRTKVAGRLSRRKALTSFALSVAMILIAVTYALTPRHSTSAPAVFHTPDVQNIAGNAQLISTTPSTVSSGVATPSTAAPATTTTVTLPVAIAAPIPAPPSLAAAAPLRPHEVFGFAPYWTLGQSVGFDVSRISTIAYFSVGVNSNGTLNESGPGWNGYQSQALVNLVSRAHAAGDRVVLTVNCFDQGALNQLTSSRTAPATLATALLGAMQAKNLDGVNLDFEGKGGGDQTGLTNLVSEVSSAIHSANPHYQVTMDTYASSAGDPNGFYNIRALAPAVDAFFVMEYQLNLQSSGSPQSPLTSAMFSDKTAIDQYVAEVPASKVILGLPYFGIDWPTNNGTLSAQATGPGTPLSYGQVVAGGHPIYWDQTTDTAWTSYLVGRQWHETYFEDPSSLYEVAQLANEASLAGVGIWALGMDGNDPSMLSALLGFAPAAKDGALGPTITTSSPTLTSTTDASSPTSTSSVPDSASPTILDVVPTSIPDVSTTTLSDTSDSGSTTTDPATTSTASTEPASTTTSTLPTSTTTSSTVPNSTTTTTSGTTPPKYQYSGIWDGKAVTLKELAPGYKPGTASSIGELTGFSTTDPSASCLEGALSLVVEQVTSHPHELFVQAVEPGDCMNAYFVFATP
jgi:spore germination protein YaaH